MDPTVRGAPRWLFRGDGDAWDVLAASLAADPTAPCPWPIAPSGPSMQPGDGVLLWRGGRGGGVAASCTVRSEPEAVRTADGALRIVVLLHVDRAYARPISPAALLRDPALRPLAFMDLLEMTEHRVTAAQEAALARLVAARDRPDAAADPDDLHEERSTTLRVPVRLVGIVEELLVRLGADEAPPAPTGPRPRPLPDTVGSPLGSGAESETLPATAPTAAQLEQAEQLALAHGTGPFTIDAVAATWRTGIGTARSRIERLVEVGLLRRAGTQRPLQTRAGSRTRGRPPVLYVLAAERNSPSASEA